MALMLGVCGLPRKYGDTPKMPAGLINLYEGLHIAHYGKEGKGMALQ